LTAGTHSIAARYVGATPFSPSLSAPISITVRPLAESTFTLLIPWTNPQALGSPVAVSAVVVSLAGGGPAPAGTVEFLEGTTVVGTATLSGGFGTAVWTPSAAGTLTISARYLGSASMAGSSSQPAMITVFSGATPAATTTAVAVTPSPARFGQPVTFTATVTNAPATGMVTFFVDGSAAGTAPVTSVGGVIQATLTTTSLPLGPRIVSASYAGVPGFAASNAAPVGVIINP
jgi:hypothetical protein